MVGPVNTKRTMIRTLRQAALSPCLNLCLSFMLPISAMANPPGQLSDWPTYGGPPTGNKYSYHQQINKRNVVHLERQWVYRSGDYSSGEETGITTALEVTPILAGDRLYLCTPFNRVIALKPSTGKEIWRFDPNLDRTQAYSGKHVCRGVTYWQAPIVENNEPKFCDSRIFQAIQDGRLVALDAATGKLCKSFGREGYVDLNPLSGFSSPQIFMTSPPAIYQNAVIVGSSIEDNVRSGQPAGTVHAFDAKTGQLLWRWNPIPKTLQGRVGGANVWAPITVDTDNGIVFLPTSSPSTDHFGASRKEPIPHANALVALNALTGEKIWHFQTIKHDLFDYDLPAQPNLVTLNKGGEAVPAVVQVTKTGMIFTLHRLTGEPLFPVEYKAVPGSDVPGEQAASNQPFPLLPKPLVPHSLTPQQAFGLTPLDRAWCKNKIKSLRNEGIFTPPSLRGTLQVPFPGGGGNWGGAAFDVSRKILVANTNNFAHVITLIEQKKLHNIKNRYPESEYGLQLDEPYAVKREILLSPLGVPCNPPPWGTVSAIDMNTGKKLWQMPLGQYPVAKFFKTPKKWGAPTMGGPIITKSGLVFIAASPDRKIRAIDINTGQTLWSDNLPWPGIATPMSFFDQATQRQMIVIAAGGNALMGGELGDALVAYALPDQN